MLNPAPRHNLKRPFLLLLLLLVNWLGVLCWSGPAVAQFHYRDFDTGPKLTPPDQIKAVAALLIDAKTGQVLFAKNADARLLPASTTKLMTALIVYERLGFNGSVTIVNGDEAEPSNIPVRPGETISVDKLFHALLIESANDAARVLARAAAGSVPAFVDLMNQRALQMGCTNTHFYNPNGLPAPQGTHFTSCNDLMKMFRAVIAIPELRQICSTKEYLLKTAAKTQVLHNHNKLLGYYPGMGPAKTGWTEASRHTYAASDTQNGHELLLTLLDSPNKWADAQILYNWGFAQYPAPAPSGAASNSR